VTNESETPIETEIDGQAFKYEGTPGHTRSASPLFNRTNLVNLTCKSLERVALD